MKWFNELPIQRKLGLAMLMTSMFALLMACTLLLVVEFRSYRRDIEHTVATLGRLAAENSTAAIAFADPTGATQILEALRAEPQITSAAIYDNDGSLFASYRATADEPLPPSRPADAARVDFAEPGYVLGTQPVSEHGRRLGTLRVRASMSGIYARMETYGWVVAGVLISAFGLAGLLASRLRNTLARPILELADTANAVAATQDYSRRARIYSRDELGRLTEVFNSMLERSQRTVDALRESEWTYRELVRALPIAAYMCDAEGRINLVNEAAVNLWGRVPEIGREFWCGAGKLYGADGTPLRVEQCPAYRALREGRTVNDGEIVVEQPDGTLRNVAPHSEPIRDTNGQIVGIVSMMLDITEQKRTNAANRQLAAIVESSDDAIIGKDLDGNITSWNAGAERLYGYTAREIIGQPVTVLIPPERPNEEPEILARVRRDERIDQYETVRCRRDGTRIEVSLRVSPIKDSAGRIIGASKIARDITRRKQTERALRASEEQLRLVTDNAPVLLVRVDRDHRFTFVNRAYAERNGYSAEGMLGLHIVEVIGEEAYAAFRHYLDTALTGQRVEFEIMIPYRRIGRRWVHVVYVPEHDAAGRITGVLGVLTDTGARKEAELELKRARDEAVAASRAKDDFLAALSHELRTPLNPVLLLASDAAEDTDLPPAVREKFEAIRKNVNLEARLIDDLLDLTRIARGKLRLEQRPCEVQTTLRDAIENVRPELEGKHQELVVDADPIAGVVWGDAVRLQQVFWNVLKNAVKFTPEHGRIEVTVRRAEPERILVSVKDSGVGMTPEEIKRAFLAFSQGDHATPGIGSHRFGGLGLGLAITKTLVEMHGGQIRAQSEGHDRGATFEVELPLAREELRAAGKPPSEDPFLAAAGDEASRVVSQWRVLLVEDHAATRLVLQQLLRNRDYHVFAAATAAEARAIAAKEELDLVVSDVGLPDGTGYQLMKELLARQPGLRGIALSGYGMEEDVARSREAGFALHLTKPITVGKLETAMLRLSLPSTDSTLPNGGPA